MTREKVDNLVTFGFLWVAAFALHQGGHIPKVLLYFPIAMIAFLCIPKFIGNLIGNLGVFATVLFLSCVFLIIKLL